MNWRSSAAFLHDIAVAVLAWLLAHWLRFNLDIPPNFAGPMWRNLALILPVQAAVFYAFGLYRGLWRFASIPDLRRIALAAAVAAVTGPTLLFMVSRLSSTPRSVLLLDPILLLLFMGGSRFLYRAWKDGHLFSPAQLGAQPVLVLGAGTEAATLLRELAHSPQWRVVGLLDDDADKAGSQLHGVRVLGTLDTLPLHAKRMDLGHVIVAMPEASVTHRRHVVEAAVAAGLQVLTIPAMADLLAGRVAISQVRRVELEDLLGRDSVQLDDAGLHRLLTGKVVLVTGAGGSIGSELCRQIARFQPARLVFYEQSEFALYAIEQEFARHHAALPVRHIVGDVKDAERLARVFAAEQPQVVFHAAAYKHVPLMETDNAWQAVRNNVLGTACVARAAMAAGVEKFVLISTDKAVNPTNVMGATKRLAECLCQQLQARSLAGGLPTRFVMVRFGNVLGSSGSVIPKFREQIARGGPITVTHPDIVRYFMLIPEAAQLVLQAGLMGDGGEIFVLDMGEPIRIVDLARDMIRLSGFEEGQIGIEFTGLRPGEKLYEELLADDETTLTTPHPKLRVARARHEAGDDWLARLDAWLDTAQRDDDAVKTALQGWVPEYRRQHGVTGG